jgi:GNAT superfamily N-acetyltransferase
MRDYSSGSRAAKLPAVPTIHEVQEDGLERWVATMRAVLTETGTAADYLDWKRQAEATVWLVACDDDRDVGAAQGVHGWHSPAGVARGEVRVVSDARGRGIGDLLLDRLGDWARRLGNDTLTGEVREQDATSLAWCERRGYVEVGRNAMLALDLATVEPPAVAPPDGVEIVSWAERPELARAMYAVACEAYPDVPGEEDAEIAPYEAWLSMDMQGASDRPEATFVALARDDVVGYAKLSLSNARPGVAMHDITGVLRAWRGRGIAGALKRAEIAWAKEQGFTRLETYNEERNEPVQRLNRKHGYRLEPGTVVVRGPIPAERSA